MLAFSSLKMPRVDTKYMKKENWFVLQLKPNSHNKAKFNLDRQGFKTFSPMQKITKRKSTKFIEELIPLFPGYMFVSFDPLEPFWQKLNSTIGVSKLLTCNGKPQEVPIDLINAIKLRCDGNDNFFMQKKLSVGDSIVLMSGPFSNFIATIERTDKGRKSWALLDILGRKAKFKLNY